MELLAHQSSDSLSHCYYAWENTKMQAPGLFRRVTAFFFVSLCLITQNNIGQCPPEQGSITGMVSASSMVSPSGKLWALASEWVYP